MTVYVSEILVGGGKGSVASNFTIHGGPPNMGYIVLVPYSIQYEAPEEKGDPMAPDVVMGGEFLPWRVRSTAIPNTIPPGQSSQNNREASGSRTHQPNTVN